jgi:uncharacterized protein (DUF983 family)
MITMNVPQKKATRSYLAAVLTCRCPRCRDGKLFKHTLGVNFKKNMEMNPTCLVCGQPTEIEVGFYYGTSYVSYVLTIVLSVATLVAWWLVIGFSLHDNRFFFWVIFNAVFLLALQPWLMRLSRSLWISWFVKNDPDWQKHNPADVSERMNPDQATNW